MRLLRTTKENNYPSDYLLARVRIRKALLAERLDSLIAGAYAESDLPASEHEIWKTFLDDYRWVYIQMNKRLFKIFWPFFFFAELKTIIICLRYKEVNEKNKIKEILESSLLSDQLKNIIEETREIVPLIESLDDMLNMFLDKPKRLRLFYDERGLKSVEETIIHSYLKYMLSMNIHPVIKSFFVYIADIRNVIAFYKYQRWDIVDLPVFLCGGTLHWKKLQSSFNTHEISGIKNIVYKLTRIKLSELNGRNIEDALTNGLSVFLNKMGRDPLGLGIILEYLWMRYLTAVRQNTIFYSEMPRRDGVL